MSESPILVPEDQKGYQCEIILDSINPVGVRLTTMRVKYPLIVHAEWCRHRCFSRSVASNRAIPTARIIAMVEQDPFEPVFWGKNQPGMQANEEVETPRLAAAAWDQARRDALLRCRQLVEMDVHKQIANRLLAPFQWVTEIITATDWENFFALRCHPAAQRELRRIAEMARDARHASEPEPRFAREWHLPFVFGTDRDLSLETVKKISAARCARTSYRTHAGRISTPEEDIKLYERLVGSRPIHASPLEHQAEARGDTVPGRNFRGWVQARCFLDGDTIPD